jgi:hypothetical protein
MLLITSISIINHNKVIFSIVLDMEFNKISRYNNSICNSRTIIDLAMGYLVV